MEVTASIVIRRPQHAGESLAQLPRDEAERLLSATPEDLSAVKKFAEQHGLEVVSESPETRTVKIRGTVEQIAAAFGVTFSNEGGILHPQTAPEIPPSLTGIAIAILGLDQRPIARRVGQ